MYGWSLYVVAAEKESSVAAVEKKSSVAAAAAAVAVAVEGGCGCYLLYKIYYFIVVDILFYCNGYIILL